MTEKYTPSRKFTLKRAEINTDLRDMGNLGLPVNLAPVWPEVDTQGVAQLIKDAKKDIAKTLYIDKTITGNESKFLQAQLRALDYLYGNRDEAFNDNNKNNPLVDIIALVANVGDAKSTSSTFQIAVEGRPDPISLITKTPKAKKPEQRTYEVTPWGRKEYRTISRFSGQISTVLKGLSLLTEASKHHPLIIRSTIHEYSNNFDGGSSFVAGTAMGLLEILNNLDLINDGRFYFLSSELREVVFEEVKSYKELKERYSYRVVDKRAFWYQGEVDTYARRRMNYIKVDGVDKIKVDKFPKFTLPKITGWQSKSKERSKIIKKHRELTLFNSLKRTAVNFSEDKAIQALSEDRLKKADLTEQRRSLESKQYDKLRRTWKKFIELEIDEGSNITENEEKLVKNAVDIILNFFVKDPTLSQKARTNILGVNNDNDKCFYYQIDSKELAEDIVFSWVLSLRNPYIAKGLKNSLHKSDEACESFYLLTKLMVFDILKKSLGTKEHKFLFDPNYKHKLDSASIYTLFEDIEKLGEKYTPNINDIVKEAVRKNYSNIVDLLSEASIEKMKKSLEKLTYKTILGRIRKDRARAITKGDKKRAIKIAKWALFIFGPFAVGLVGQRGLIKLRDVIDTRNEERLEAEIAESLAEERERLAKEAEIRRLQGLQARAISRAEGGNSREEIISAAANMARIPSEMADRIPDAINADGEGGSSRENSERYGLTGFGKIYHLPEHLSVRDGQAIGYFPWDINLATTWDNDLDTLEWLNHTRDVRVFEEVIIADSFDFNKVEIGPNQLAYSLNGVNAEIYPPVGWKIVKVYQEGGKQPMIGPLGELYYAHDNYENFPGRVLLVLEETPREFVDPKIAILSEATAHNYWPYYHARHANEVTSFLEGDKKLQEIHANFVKEMDVVYDDIRYYYGKVTYEEAEKAWSDIAIKYAKLYADYTVQERYYALDFQIDKSKDGEYLSLRALADQPDNGYFCSVASFAFRDFMRSVGIVSGNQPGIALYNYQGYLWGGLGHQNNVVFLPDGRILEVDMTPYTSDKTPTEDISWLTGRIVTKEEIDKAIDDMINNTYGGLNTPEGRAPSTEEEMLLQIARDNEKIRIIQNNEKFTSDFEVNTTIEDISQSVRDMLTTRLRNVKDFTTTSNNDVSVEDQQEIKLLSRISINAQRVQENAVSMEDVYLDKASGEQILDKYDLTEQVIRDAKLLQTILNAQKTETRASDEALILDEIILDMEKVQNALNLAGGTRLQLAREDRILISEFEAEYRKFWELEGKYAADKYDLNLLSKPEILRAERYRELNTEIDDLGLVIFEEQLKHINNDALGYIYIAHMHLNNNSENVTEEFNDSPWYTNSDVIQYSTIVRRRINNTSFDLYNLDEKSKEVVENLPSTLRRMKEILNGDHVNLEGEIETMEIYSRDLLYLRNNLDNIYQQKQHQASYDASESKRLLLYTERYLSEREKRNVSENTEKEAKALDLSSFSDVAKALGVGVIPLAIGYLGIRSFNKRKKKTAILNNIQESLNAGNKLTRIEKDIVLSTIGHLTHLAYDDGFPEKAAVLLNLIQQYSPTQHEDAIRWLTNEGADTLYKGDVKKSFTYLAELSNGKARDESAKEIRRYFPANISEELDILSKKNGGNGKNTDINIPHDFDVIYGISQILFNNSLMNLQKDVRRRLEIEDINSEISVSYKFDDVLDLLRSKYAANNTPEKAKSLFNSILLLLNWNTVSDKDPIFTD